MKRIFQLCFTLVFFALGFSQSLKPVAEKVKQSHTANRLFVKYDFFTVDESVQKKQTYSTAATGITVMKLNTNEIQRINTERPEALEMSFPYEGNTITVELVKNNFLTNDFKVNTDKGYAAYTPGVYYQGIVKGDNNSLVAISFFENDIAGVSSIPNVGNIVLGKAKNSEDFISYNDINLKKTNDFKCETDDLLENRNADVPSFDPSMMNTTLTENCVRVYYEAAFNIFTNFGSSTSNATNWVTAMHNNISTLYTNDGITIALSEVFVWTSADPYTGSGTSDKLNQFNQLRPNFNGDVGQLIKYRNPVSGGIAFLNTLCTANKHSYVDVQLNYANVPTFSWNIEAMTHEIGHSLGSPHTHDCAWNGNNTRIDGCGPAAGDAGNGTCASASIPSSGTGGTIMSYCHLLSSVGINFANGFGPQPSALIRNRINTRACLGTDCITSCTLTVSGLVISNIAKTSFTATITDNTGTSWKYKLAKPDGTVVQEGSSTTKILNFTNLEQGKYYTIAVGNDCSGPNAFSHQQLILTDADWCAGVVFTDSGGTTADYGNLQSTVKTFYPVNPTDKLKMTFTQFDIEPGSDFMNVYDGASIASPRFTNGSQLSGTTIPGPFQATNASGAITVRFISNASVTRPGWSANLECLTLATNETNVGANINISKTAQKGIFTLTSKDKILSYKIFDASGKMVVETSNVNADVKTLDIAKYPAGTYVVSITTSKETVTKKIIR